MNTFLWLQDYQWNAISSIATAIGVLLALYIPLRNHKAEKNNIIYFQAKNLQRLLDNVERIKVRANDHKSDKDRLITLAEGFIGLEIPHINKEAKELAKYDTKLYELLVEVSDAYRSVQDHAKDIVYGFDSKDYELNLKWFDGVIATADCILILNYCYLYKKKVVKKDWTPVSLCK